jgi:hypothetical protein
MWGREVQPRVTPLSEEVPLVRWIIRVVGIAVTLTTIVFWVRGGIYWTIDYRGVKADLPVHYGFAALGIALCFAPIFMFRLVTAILPPRVADRLEEVLPKPTADTASSSADFSDRFEQALRRLNRRYFVTLGVMLVLLTLIGTVVALLFLERAGETEFKAASRSLVKLVQTEPLDFSSSDYYRAQLRETQTIVAREPDTATARLHSLLSAMYVDGVGDAKAFSTNLASVYDRYVRSTATGVSHIVPDQTLNVTVDTSLDAPGTKTAMLTALGVLCNSQGDQGAFIEPYLLGRQFLRAALSSAPSGEPVPLTYNAIGVNYAGSMTCYDDYCAVLDESTTEGRQVRAALADGSPLPRLTMARLADESYARAAAASGNNFVRARALNNRADLRVALIVAVHLRNEDFRGRDQADATFLKSNVDPPDQPNLAPKQLWRILLSLRRDLNSAAALSRDPHIFFTRAQLHSVTGAICEKYHHKTDPCDPATLTSAALQDLGMARQLQLPPHLFSEARAHELHLSWLWSRKDARVRLESLASDGLTP